VADQLAEAGNSIAQVPREFIALGGMHTDYEQIRQIAHHADDILKLVSDMNTLTPESLEEQDFATLKQAINNRLKDL
jgi:hypothetical protein